MPNGSLQTDGVVLADSVSSPVDEIAAAQQSIQNSLDSGRPRYPYQTLLTENMIDFDDDEPGIDVQGELATTTFAGKSGFNWERAERAVGNVPLPRMSFTTKDWGFYISNKYNEMDDVIKRGSLGWQAMLGRVDDGYALTYGNINYLNSLSGVVPDAQAEGLLLDMVGEASSLARYMMSSTKTGLKGGVTLAGLYGGVALAAGNAGPQAAAPEEIVTIPYALKKGFKNGFALGVIYNTTVVEGGGIYLNLLEDGISREVARPTALAAGLGIGMIEVMQLKTLAAPWKKAFSNHVAKSKTMQRWLGKSLIAYMKTVGTEIAQEDLQEAMTITGEAIAGLLDENPNVIPTSDQIVERIKQTTIQTLKGVAIISLPGGVVGAAVDKPGGRANLRQVMQSLKIKQQVMEKGEYIENTESPTEARKRADDLEKTLIRTGGEGATVSVDGNKVTVTDVGLTAADILAIAKQKAEGEFHVKMRTDDLGQAAEVVQEALGDRGTVTVDLNTSSLVVNADAQIVQEISRVDPTLSRFTPNPYNISGGSFITAPLTKSQAKGVRSRLNALNKNLLINVTTVQEKTDDGLTVIKFKIDNKTLSATEINNLDAVEVTIENLRQITEVDNFTEKESADTLQNVASALTNLLTGKGLTSIQRILLPNLAVQEDTILELVKTTKEAGVFEQVANERVIIDLLLESLEAGEVAEQLGEESIKLLRSAVRQAFAPFSQKKQNIKVLQSKVRGFIAGTIAGRVLTLKEVKTLQRQIVKLIKEALPAEQQGQFLSFMEDIQTAEQFREQSQKLFDELTKLRRQNLIDRIMGISPKNIPAEFARTIKAVQSLLKSPDATSKKILESLAPLRENMTQEEMDRLFAGAEFDPSLAPIEVLEKAFQVLDAVRKLGRVEQKLLSIDRFKRIEAAKEFFRDQVETNGKPDRLTSAFAWIMGAKGITEEVDARSLIKKWFEDGHIRPELLYTFMGWKELFTNLSKGEVGSRSGFNKSSAVIDAILGETDTQTLHNTDVDTSEVDTVIVDEIEERFGEGVVGEGEDIDATQVRLSKIKQGVKISLDGAMAIYAWSLRPESVKNLLATGYTYADLTALAKIMEQKNPDIVEKIGLISEFLTSNIGRRVQETQVAVGAEVMDLLENYFTLVGSIDAMPSESNYLLELLEQNLRSNGVQVSDNFAEHRTGAVSKLKNISYTQSLFNYLAMTEKYIAVAPAMHDVNVLLSDKSMRESIERNYGKDWYNEMWKHLRDFATGTKESNKGLSNFFRVIRENSYSAFLGFNLFSIMRQPISWLQGAYYIGEVAATRGLVDFIGNPLEIQRQVNMRSALIRNRGFTQQRDFERLGQRNVRVNASRWKTVLKRLQKGILHPNQAADIAAVTALWWGAYRKGIDYDQMSEQEARDYADTAIRRTQPMGGALYLPATFRGNQAEKLFTMFLNQTNQNLNLVVEKAYNLREGELSKGEAALDVAHASFFYIMAPAFLLGLLSRRARLPEEPEDYAYDVINYMTSPMPFMGKLIKGFTTDSTWLSLTPVESWYEETSRALQSDSITEGVMRGSKAVMGWGLGLPVRNIEKLVTGEAFEEKK